MKRMRAFFQSPFFLALPVTIIFIFFLPDIFRKYKIEIVEKGVIHKKDGFESSGQMGIFFMTRSNDSILLHGVCAARSNKILFRNQFITTLSQQNGKLDYSLVGIYLYDLDHNGTKEIISGIMAGFQVQPRLLFVYDIGSGRIIKTPPMANFQSVCDTADLNGDGFPELLARKMNSSSHPAPSSASQFLLA